MAKKTLSGFWQSYLNQSSPISPETQALVAAQRARIDQLELANAILRGKLKEFVSEEALKKMGPLGMVQQ